MNDSDNCKELFNFFLKQNTKDDIVCFKKKCYYNGLTCNYNEKIDKPFIDNLVETKKLEIVGNYYDNITRFINGPSFQSGLTLLSGNPLHPKPILNYTYCTDGSGQVYQLNDGTIGDSLGFRFFSMHVFDQSPERRSAAMEELLPMLATGKIQPAISLRMPLKDARQAHELFDSGKILGKLLLKP